MVQSLFGVGLLVFGTPTLLLLGLPFDRVLMLLLPCSIVVSALQVATSGGLSLDPFRRQFLTFTTPVLLLATAMTLRLGSPGGIRVLVGLMLLVTAGTRLIRPAHAAFARVVRGHLPPLLVGLGVLHGASNLGGGILSVIVGTSFELEAGARRHVTLALLTSIDAIEAQAAELSRRIKETLALHPDAPTFTSLPRAGLRFPRDRGGIGYKG